MDFRVLLVAMPWARLEHPSIQLGLLKALLDARGIASKQLHVYLDFAEHLAARDDALGADAYDDVATRHLIGDWIFSVPPFWPADTPNDGYLQHLRNAGEDDAFLARVTAIREAVPSFLDRAVDQLLSFRPDIVGFTTTFGQTVASLVMAQLLKQRAPGIKIILGGANCDGVMGEALHRSFPWIDVVVRGEAEPVFGDLVDALLHGRTPAPRPGLCLREGKEIVIVPMTPPAPQIAAREFVEYDDYFARLDGHRFASEISPHVSIPFETSRGCWWGEKHHCTFCGLNGSGMTFRRVDPQRAFDELLYLADRYQRLDFNAADNILDRNLFATLIPRLMRSQYDFRIFYEVKANLRKSEVARLAAAGITEIQPGIESLSTAALRRVRKGITALENIRLLKWCVSYGIKVHWNIIHGLPGDTSAEYVEMVRVARECFHLEAPNLVPLSVERFSPYHDTPDAFGIEILGPTTHYRFTYPVEPRVLTDIAYAFDHRQRWQPTVEPGLASLRQVVDDWQAAQQSAGTGTLKLLRGPGFSVIRDRRPGRSPADYRLGTVEAQIYEACDDGIGISRLQTKLGPSSPSETRVRKFLSALVDAGLALREGERYLSLAVEARPRECDAASVGDALERSHITLTEIAVGG
jgi:ribosomal peptide maturation radical SAM protein 1